MKKCDEDINKLWDSGDEDAKQARLNKVKEYSETLDLAAIKGAKHNNCDTKVATKNLFGGMNKPITVAMMLGRLKHDCVEEKLRAKPPRFTSVEQPFLNGKLVDQYTQGHLRPDIVVHKDPLEGSGDVVAVFDLKFPCPSESNLQGQWGTRKDGTAQNVAYREEFPGATVALIYPALKK